MDATRIAINILCSFIVLGQSAPAQDMSLAIARSNTTVVVSWPSSATGFVLEQNLDLSITNGWSKFGGNIQNNGTNITATVAASAGKNFFRANSGLAVPSLSITSATRLEGTGGSQPMRFTVSRTGDLSGTTTVRYATTNNTAITGFDYFAVAGTLTILPGMISITIDVSIVGDSVPEADETFFVNLSAPYNGTIGVARGVGTIQNDD